MAVAVVLGGLTVLVIAVYIIYNYIWPDFSSWTAECRFFEDVRYGKDAIRWTSPREQQADDLLSLDIGKRRVRGRGRLLKKITLLQGTGHALDYPKRWKVTLANEEGTLPGFEGKQEEDSLTGSGIVITLDPPQKVTHIMVTILEPRPGYKWAMSDMELEEEIIHVPQISLLSRRSRASQSM